MQFPPGFEATLPPLYAAWMLELLEGPIPAEKEATCHDCPMCDRTGNRNNSGYIFNSESKCCTYIPDLPNFLVGRILKDDDPALAKGRAAFEAEFHSRLVVSPLGANPSDDYTAVYKRNIEFFGRKPNLRCPYYIEEAGGLCGIWKHRNATCATWFCKFVRGSVGVIFWKYVDHLLTSTEKFLSYWCIHQLDIGGSALEMLFPPPPTERTSAEAQQAWGNWKGREIEFFQKCADLVDSLSWQEVERIGGAELQTYAELTRRAYQKLISSDVPEYLNVGSWKSLTVVDDQLYRVWTYSQYDPVDLPKEILDVLHYFNGRSIKDALEIISLEKGISLDSSYVLKLSDFGILVPA